MTRRALIGCLFLSACATVGGPVGRAPTRPVDLQGSLALSDGAPVPGVKLVVRCGTVEQSAVTDDAGRFMLRALPEGTCLVGVPAAHLARTVNARAGVMARVDLRLPPRHRITLEWSEGTRSGAVVLDETVPHRLRAGSVLVSLHGGALVVGEGANAARLPLGGLENGLRLRAEQAKVRVTSVERRPWMPIGLRRAPTTLASLALLSHDGQLVRPGLGVRTLAVAGGCEQLRLELLDELEALAVTHEGAGLRVMSILTHPCPTPSHGAQVLLGGPEALSALGTKPGELAVLDGDGRPVRRLASVDEARAFLGRSWPAFAAASKVSVAASATVLEAEADRLLAQARAKEKEGKHADAHQLLDRVLQLSPDMAEARKERALIKAKLGDLSGALREVTWWRTSFGSDSADDLQDQLEQTARVSTLR